MPLLHVSEVPGARNPAHLLGLRVRPCTPPVPGSRDNGKQAALAELDVASRRLLSVGAVLRMRTDVITTCLYTPGLPWKPGSVDVVSAPNARGIHVTRGRIELHPAASVVDAVHAAAHAAVLGPWLIDWILQARGWDILDRPVRGGQLWDTVDFTPGIVLVRWRRGVEPHGRLFRWTLGRMLSMQLAQGRQDTG